MLGRLYSSTLRANMDKEEQSLFILAEQLLNDDDWKKIKSETQFKPDPIFGEAIEGSLSFDVRSACTVS